MTPQFLSNLHIIHGQPMSWTLAWALVAILCTVAAWRFGLIVETERRPGVASFTKCVGVLGFGACATLPWLMVAMKAWAAVEFA